VLCLHYTTVLWYREAARIPQRRLLRGMTRDEVIQLSDDPPPITQQDIDAAIISTPKTVTNAVVNRHETWKDQFGCEY